MPRFAFSFLSGCLLFCACSLAPATVCASQLSVVTESLPPLNFEEHGSVTGYSTEIVQAVLQEAKLAAPIELIPWARAYQRALQQPNTLIYSMTRTPERDAQFEWIGVLSNRQIYLYKLKSRTDIQIKTLTDAGAYKTGLVREMASAKEFMRKGQFPDYVVDYAPTDESNMKKFLMGRVDLAIFQNWSAAFLMKSQNRTMDEIEPLLLLDGSSNYYLAMSKNSDPALVKKLRKAFEKVQQSGLFDKLRLKYLR
jgi:polar amino acid transport system substrate-binding protein